jgi:hypothetical protein
MVGEQQPAEKAKKSHTPEEFITKWPLYTPFPYEKFSAPSSVSFHCDGDCGKETTWFLTGDPTFQSSASPGFHWVQYVCGLCKQRYLLVIYREFAFEMRPIAVSVPAGRALKKIRIPTKYQKIGQFPPPSVNVPKLLQNSLGELATGLYKKSLVTRNEGYGLAAVTYIRRVVEDKTDELIEVVAQLAETHSLPAAVIEQIRAAKNERTTYENKLKIAATVVPESLIVDGANPLGALYDLVSVGVHDLTEEQCIAVADETKSVFEFTFTHLRAETKIRHDFVAKVKKWVGGKGLQKDEQA